MLSQYSWNLVQFRVLVKWTSCKVKKYHRQCSSARFFLSPKSSHLVTSSFLSRRRIFQESFGSVLFFLMKKTSSAHDGKSNKNRGNSNPSESFIFRAVQISTFPACLFSKGFETRNPRSGVGIWYRGQNVRREIDFYVNLKSLCYPIFHFRYDDAVKSSYSWNSIFEIRFLCGPKTYT